MLRGEELFISSTTTRPQCCHACRVLRVERSAAVPYAIIGRIRGIDRSAVKRHFQKGADHLDKASASGRPSILSDEEHEHLIRTITEAYRMRRPMSIGEISYYIETRFQKSIERNMLRHMLRRDTGIKFCRGVPMEQPRLDAPIEALGNLPRCGCGNSLLHNTTRPGKPIASSAPVGISRYFGCHR
jgi:transposase